MTTEQKEHRPSLTQAQREALSFLIFHGATGVFGRHGVLLTAGVWSPFKRSTWNALVRDGYLRCDGKRLSVTTLGHTVDLCNVHIRDGLDQLGEME